MKNIMSYGSMTVTAALAILVTVMGCKPADKAGGAANADSSQNASSSKTQ